MSAVFFFSISSRLVLFSCTSANFNNFSPINCWFSFELQNIVYACRSSRRKTHFFFRFYPISDKCSFESYTPLVIISCEPLVALIESLHLASLCTSIHAMNTTLGLFKRDWFHTVKAVLHLLSVSCVCVRSLDLPRLNSTWNFETIQTSWILMW